MNCSRSLLLSALITFVAAGQAQAKPLAKPLLQSLANSPKAIPIAVILPVESIDTGLIAPQVESGRLVPATPVRFDRPIQLDPVKLDTARVCVPARSPTGVLAPSPQA
jgi:hypothetical protein